VVGRPKSAEAALCVRRRRGSHLVRYISDSTALHLDVALEPPSPSLIAAIIIAVVRLVPYVWHHFKQHDTYLTSISVLLPAYPRIRS
jgi:hypothetical protein